MPMPLEQWQQKLEGHFSNLAAARSSSGYPLFAIEHGLTEDDLREIGGMLRSRMKAGLPLRSHWLLWVVYSTEFGYHYAGGEYWHPVEDSTTNWDLNLRRQLRGWFQRFQKMYNGVVPSGPWAEWFSIIAWPITHSILPKYLQGQFAKALYDLRYRLIKLDTLGGTDVGRLLAENTWDASSRFREFLQQEELVGRIVQAILSEKKAEGISPIYEPTLERLVNDLEKIRSAREWLKVTRRLVADRLKGAGRDFSASSTVRLNEPFDHNDKSSLPTDLRPRLMLRRSGMSLWSVILEIRSFAPLARTYPELRHTLKTSRCKITGSADTWLPAGWLLAGSQRRVLKSWPNSNVPLIKFERPDTVTDHLVGSEAHLSKGTVWVCRINADGLAYEIIGRTVRPDHRYIVLRQSPFTSENPMLSRCAVDCDGVNGALLSIPTSVTADDIKSLTEMGLQIARTVIIQPVGLVGRGWDGEGNSEWLTSESPSFSIIHDHPVESYSLRLDAEPEVIVKAGAGAAKLPVLISIPPLSAGRHILSVKAHRDPGSYPPSVSAPAEGFVRLDIREPEPWIAGRTSFRGFSVHFDPHDPSLDSFWENEVSISVFGPEGRNVTCSIILKNAMNAEILTEQIGAFSLPITNVEWSKRFLQFVREQKRTWAYLEASAGRFIIQGDELGTFTLPLERDFKPIRWICQNIKRTTKVRLIDDTGQDDIARCRFYSLNAPANRSEIDVSAALAGYAIEAPGGLFVAQHGDFQDAIVITVPQIEYSLGGLSITPDLQRLDLGSFQVTEIIGLLRVWRDARVVGPLAGIRRGRVIARLANHLYARLCGNKWAEAEEAFIAAPESAAALQNLERCVGGSQGFPVILRRDYKKMEMGTKLGSEWYGDVAERYQVCADKSLSELSLRLSSAPDQLARLEPSESEALLVRFHNNGVLLRGARLVALLASIADSNSIAGTFPRWKW